MSQFNASTVIHCGSRPVPEISSLAIGGAAPAFPSPLLVGTPNVGDEESLMRRFRQMLDGRCFSNDGPLVREFEARIAETVGVRHCVAVCNATTALQLTIRALGLSGEVIVPSMTFIATAHALQWQGIAPRFCDISPETHNLDPGEVERLITPRTSAILGVHLWGRACEVEALAELAARHRLALFFDAAHGFLCSHGGTMLGSFGAAEVFSFHATKFANSFEGGAIVTNDDSLAARLRSLRNFGFHGSDLSEGVGTNGKMPEVCAAMGLTSLDAAAEIVAANRANYHAYQQGFRGVPGLRMLRYDERERCNYQYVVVEVNPAEAGLSRDELIQVLRAENVLARRYFHPGCHRMSPYGEQAHAPLPHTERLGERLLVLPTGTSVSPEDADTICRVITLAVRHAGTVLETLSGRTLGLAA